MKRLIIGVIAAAIGSGMIVPGLGHAASPADDREGERLFQQNCSLCHIPQPYTPRDTIAKKLGKGVLAGRVDRARNTIKTGLRGAMPGFRYALTDVEVEKIIAYLSTVDEKAPTVVKPLPATPISHEGTLLLTGNVKSAKGENMEGVAISARIDGQSITTSVFTDKDGNYYFPPMAGATYQVWAQAIGYEGGRAPVALSGAVKRQNFQLKETTEFISQLTGAGYLEALPVDTPEHRRMRDVFRHSCNTCHPIGVTLRNRYDEEGWTVIVDTMSRTGGMGELGEQRSPHIDHFRKDLIAYLTEIRGPGPSPMTFKVPARPTGASTLPVVYQYDIPLEEYGGFHIQNGTDWSQGTPSNSYGVRGQHDSAIDLNGNIWAVKQATKNKNYSYGRIDTKTGAFTGFPVPIPGTDEASSSHSASRMPDGNVAINLSYAVEREVPGDGGGPPTRKRVPYGAIGIIDVKTGKIRVFEPPPGIPSVYLQLDVDGKGFIWASTAEGDGGIRLDPRTNEWKVIKSPVPPQDGGRMYGITGLPGGGAAWAKIGVDKIVVYKEDSQAVEVDVPRLPFISEKDITPEDSAWYASMRFGNAQSGPPWQQGPRRLNADRNGDEVWAGGHLGDTLIRVNTTTMTARSYKVPQGNYAPYMAAIDRSHNVWVGLQGSQSVLKFEPAAEKWTYYRWPSLGANPRHISVNERADGTLEVVTSFWGTSAAGRMVMRAESEVNALKAKADAAR